VAELRGTVEQLQRENAALTRQNESGRANYATPAQLSAAVAQVEQTTAAALADQKRDLLQTVAQQIAKLVKETNAALAAISKSQPSRPAATMQFSDDFPKEGLTHTVRPGETLSMIARKYNVSMRNIQNANRLADPTRIHAGQNLFIPGAASAATSAPPVRHTN
jgi:LysM repeat protein